MVSYAHLLAQVDRWCQTVVPVFRECIESAVSGFTVDDLPRNIGDEEYLALASRRVTRNRRGERLRSLLDAGRDNLEAYLTSGFHLHTLWDSQSFEEARNAAFQKAGALTTLGPVGIAIALQPPGSHSHVVIRAPGRQSGVDPRRRYPGPLCGTTRSSTSSLCCTWLTSRSSSRRPTKP